MEKEIAEATDGMSSVQQLAKRHYENFPLATGFLPGDLQEDIRRLYAYARTVDDIGDEAQGNRSELLDRWEEGLNRCFDGTPEHEVLEAVQKTIRKHDLPKEPFRRLIEANRRDQHVKRYETWEDLLEYCTYSANPCGRLYLMVCGYRDEKRFALSDATCTALQLANFWQDVGIDLQKDRVYIPQKVLGRYDIASNDLYRWDREECSPDSFVEMMDELVHRTGRLFAKGLDLVTLVRPRLRFDLLLFTLGGSSVLKQLRAQQYPVFEKRVKLEGMQRWSIFPRALWHAVSGQYDDLKRKIVIDT